MNTIERTTLIRAPRERVWKFLTNIEDFAKWFSVEATTPFAPGARVDMKSTHKLGKGAEFYVVVDRMDAPHTFSWHWRPGAVKDLPSEPTTVVTFTLKETPEGTEVTVTETGFDLLTLERRAKAFRENEEGWKIQMAAFETYVNAAR